MKKLLALLMALVFVFSFAACSSKDKDDKKDEKGSTTVASSKKEPSATGGEDVEGEDNVAEEDLRTIMNVINTAYDSIDAEEIFDRTGVEGEGAEELLMIINAMKSNSSVMVTSIEPAGDIEVIATVEITFPDAKAAIELFFAVVEEIAAENPDLTEEEENEIIITALAESFADPDINTVTSSISVKLVSMNDTWRIVDESVFILDVCTEFIANIQEADTY